MFHHHQSSSSRNKILQRKHMLQAKICFSIVYLQNLNGVCRQRQIQEEIVTNYICTANPEFYDSNAGNEVAPILCHRNQSLSWGWDFLLKSFYIIIVNCALRSSSFSKEAQYHFGKKTVSVSGVILTKMVKMVTLKRVDIEFLATVTLYWF